MIESTAQQPLDADSMHRSPSVRNWLIGLSVAGILLRVSMIWVPSALRWDHHEYVIWGQRMIEQGPLQLYDGLPPDGLAHNPISGNISPPGKRQRCNYPPLAGFVIYAEALALRSFDIDMVSNTRIARLCFSGATIAADLILAAGCVAIARRLGGSRITQVVAFAAIALGPPFVIDCAIWGQTDSHVLAPLVWMTWFMMDRRWLTAGVLWGIALGLKTQAILAAPIWLVALLLVWRMRVVFGGLIALAVLFGIGLPFTLASGWGWFDRAFVHNLLNAYPRTTLFAFNVWYLDLLVSENDDSTLRLWGVAKDHWGRLLLLGSLLAATLWSIRRRWRSGSTIVLFSAAALLFTVMLPTRVHERYILLPIPFLIAATGLRKRLWWGVAPLMAAATFQLLVLHWMPLGIGAHSWGYVVKKIEAQYAELSMTLSNDQFAQIRPPSEELARIRPQFVADRAASGYPPKEWALTVLELASFIACIVLLARDNQPAPREMAGYRDG